MNEDIKKALAAILGKQSEVGRYVRYYDGDHDLAFATDKFKNTFGHMLKTMRENLCPVVVEAPADRMEIINFSSDSEAKNTMDRAWDIWQANQMEYFSHELHKQAFKCGDAFVIVERRENGRAAFFVQDSLQCVVIYDERTSDPLFAAKLWETNDKKRVRLTLYYPDRIEKYVTNTRYKAGELKADKFIPLEDADGETASMPNPFGVIPMFHFETEPLLKSAIPTQDRLNKTICDELVAQEFSAFRQRYATGLELPPNPITGERELPFKGGADRIWFTDSETAKFGEFGASDLKQFLSVEDAARLSMARVTGTPLHFFSFTMSDAISGEALKTLESRFTKRIRRAQITMGAIWAQVMKLALQIENVAVDNLTVQWEMPEQRSEAELLDNLGKKRNILQIPVDTLREEFGYAPEDIAKFNAAPPEETPAAQTEDEAREMVN